MHVKLEKYLYLSQDVPDIPGHPRSWDVVWWTGHHSTSLRCGASEIRDVNTQYAQFKLNKLNALFRRIEHNPTIVRC